MQIVAEMGCNWKNREGAFQMMGMAKALGINLIKYQLFEKSMVPKELHPFVIDEELAHSLVRVGREHGQDVFFTPMYPEAVAICERIGVKYYKIRYFDRNNLPVLRKLKKTKNKLIFVSCKRREDTLFMSMAKYQKNVKFLYCVPKYPAAYEDYLPLSLKFHGISDHTVNLDLFKNAKEWNMEYFEMHMKINDDCIEALWSKSFKELKEVLKG